MLKVADNYLWSREGNSFEYDKVNRIISEGKIERDFNVSLISLSVGFCLSKADKSTFLSGA